MDCVSITEGTLDAGFFTEGALMVESSTLGFTFVMFVGCLSLEVLTWVMDFSTEGDTRLVRFSVESGTGMEDVSFWLESSDHSTHS